MNHYIQYSLEQNCTLYHIFSFIKQLKGDIFVQKIKKSLGERNCKGKKQEKKSFELLRKNMSGNECGLCLGCWVFLFITYFN